MPSSPSDSPLRHVARIYDEAFGALEEGDLDQVARRIDAAQVVIETLGPHENPSYRERARVAYERLMGRLTDLQEEVTGELRKARAGSRALKGYGGRAESVGVRLIDEA